MARGLPQAGSEGSLGDGSGGSRFGVKRIGLNFSILALFAVTAFGCAPALDSSSNENQLSVTGPVQIQPSVPVPLAGHDDSGIHGYQLASLGTGQLPFVRSDAKGVDPFPLVLNRTVQSYVNAYLSQPEGLRRSVQRSSPFYNEMVSLLQERGLPSELVYLSYAESGFSYDGAGPWQLSKQTARRYGLRVNQWVDERRDPIKSTRAAADYLTELHDQTGSDWRMTLVAWNNGENGVDRYMHLRDASYDRLMTRLPWRTRSLLNRFMAVALIARHHNREFAMPAGSAAPTPQYRTFVARGGTSFRTIAEQQHTSVETLGRLNPALFRQCVPPDTAAYPVRLPLERQAAGDLPDDREG